MGAVGDLSPRSRTSLSWQHDWPIKPDVVLEGGNLGIDPATGHADDIDDLALLTTFRRPQERMFTTTGDTCAATAQVARLEERALAMASGEAGNTQIVMLGLRNRSRAASGWNNDTVKLEHTGPEGGPVEVKAEHKIDIESLSHEQRDQLREILLAAKALGIKEV